MALRTNLKSMKRIKPYLMLFAVSALTGAAADFLYQKYGMSVATSIAGKI